MIGALWTGISGLAAQQTALDNESHNIANVNTIGYKASRISFADQLYQDKIGKGAKVLDAEKLYTQGNLKVTGVSYDMALSGSGFFAVSDKSNTGTSETYYTRAGNFRMGDNGTLQDAAGNEVQGWSMRDVSTDDDVLSTNSNLNVFTSDYTELLGNAVVNHSNYIETFTAKASDYAQTAKADSTTIFSGYGLKSQASKTADVDALISNYQSALKDYQDNPDGTSQTAIAQVSQVKFYGDNLTKEGDQIYVYIDGNKISQNFISEIAAPGVDANGDDALSNDSTLTEAQQNTAQEDDNLAASKIATYKALADKISKVTGLVAYNVKDHATDPNYSFESSDTFYKTTTGSQVLEGMIEIRSLIPGEEFKLTEVGEISGLTTKFGQINNTSSSIVATEGIGLAGLESARDALSLAISGNQRDVFTINGTDGELLLNGSNSEDTVSTSGNDYSFKFTVYDKDSQQNVEVGPISINNAQDVDAVASGLNNGGHPASLVNDNNATLFQKYFTATNVNGALVIETNSSNYDVEFSTEVSASAATGAPTAVNGAVTFTGSNAILPNGQTDFIYTSGGTNEITNPTLISQLSSAKDLTSVANALNEYYRSSDFDDSWQGLYASVEGGELTITATGTNVGTASLDLKMSRVSGAIDKNADYSGRKGAGGEFMSIVNTIDQTGSLDSLQLRLDTLAISDSAFGEFSVDSTGLITMKQDGAEFAIGQVAIALFNNERGLDPMGNNLLAKTTQSGEPSFNINNDRTATIESETLELSTSDLSESLVNLMVFQKAFEANAKSITTSDQLLTTLLGLKR